MPIDLSQQHIVHFYGQDDRLLIPVVAEYLSAGLNRSHAALVIATPEHGDALLDALGERGVNFRAAVSERKLVLIDGRTALARVMESGQPAWNEFENIVGNVARQLQSRGGGRTELRAYGEMVALLWSAKQFSAVVRLEEFWNRLLSSLKFHLLCSYPCNLFDEDFRTEHLDGILCSHSRVMPSDASEGMFDAIVKAMSELLHIEDAEVRSSFYSNRTRSSWPELPRAEATALWLRDTVPDYAGEILMRARLHCQLQSSKERRESL